MPEQDQRLDAETIRRIRIIKAIRMGMVAAISMGVISQDILAGVVAGGVGVLTDWFLRPKFDPALNVNTATSQEDKR